MRLYPLVDRSSPDVKNQVKWMTLAKSDEEGAEDGFELVSEESAESIESVTQLCSRCKDMTIASGQKQGETEVKGGNVSLKHCNSD